MDGPRGSSGRLTPAKTPAGMAANETGGGHGRPSLMPCRTTLAIDDGLLRQLRQKVLDTGKPFQQVVNETLRVGLEKPATAARTR